MTNLPTFRDAGFDEVDLGHKRTFSRDLALVIGINDYQHGYPKLDTAVNDATVLAEILADKHKYEVTLLPDEQATLPNLTRQFNPERSDSWAGQVGPDDRVIFYFAGHGIARDSDQGPTGYLLLQDADRTVDSQGKLEMLKLHEWLQALPCRHLLVILDCCFAGAMRWSAPGTRDIPPEVIHQERYEHYIKSPAWQLITSANEKALDVAPDQDKKEIDDEAVLGRAREKTDKGHSPFAQALIEGLRDGTGDIFPPSPQPGQPAGDGLITATELILHLERAVGDAAAQVKHQQVPKLWPMTKHGSGEFVFLNPNRELRLKPAPKLDQNNNPYRTRALTEADYELFYGREDELNDLAGLVQQKPVTLVIGVSGVGKSSLVRAGLVPRFRGLTQPKDSPPSNISDYGGDEVEPDLENAPSNINPEAWQVLPVLDLQEQASLDGVVGEIGLNHSTLLIIDHLEALLTTSAEARSTFLNNLQRLLGSGQDSLRVVLTIRADFASHLKKIELFAQATRFDLAPMSSEGDLRLALERPAWAKVLYFDPPEVVGTIVEEINRGPGALALLAEFGSRMYLNFIERTSKDRAITQADYESVGSVAGFICSRATELHDHLNEVDQATLRRVMLRLMDIEGGELIRRSIRRSELDYGDDAENKRVAIILDQLTRARLLVWSTANDESRLELAHDASVQDWPLIKSWRRAEGDENFLLQRRVTRSAREWATAENEVETSPSLLGWLRRGWERLMAKPAKGSVKHLWHDSLYLPQTEQVLEDEMRQRGLKHYFFSHVLQPVRAFWLNAMELKFVQQSVDRQRRERFLTAYIIAFVIITLTIITGYAVDRQFEAVKQQGFAQKNEATAIAERNIALSRQLAAQSKNELNQSNYDLALLLAIEAGRVKDTSEAFSALREVLDQSGRTRTILVGHDGGVNQAIWNRDQSQVLTAADDGTARIWDAETGAELHRLEHNHPVGQASWSHNEKLILTWGDKFIYLWDAETGTLEHTLIGHAAKINHVAWSKSGDRILSASEDGTARVWDVRKGVEMLKLHHGIRGISYAAWNKDENLILTVGCEAVNYLSICISSSVLLWDAKTGQLQLELTPHTAAISKAEWSAAGTLILTYDVDGSVRIWDTRTGKGTRLPGDGYANEVHTEWNMEGTLVLVAISSPSQNRSEVYVWDIEQEKKLFSLPHESPVEGGVTATWNTSETEIMTTDDDMIYIWDAETGEEMHTLRHDSSVKLAQWSDDETQIVSVSREVNGNTIKIWDVATEKVVATMAGHQFNIEQIIWNADQSLILSASDDGKARIWNLKNKPEGLILNHPGVDYAVWNGDESLILSYGANKLRLWDAQSGKKKDEWFYVGDSYGYWDWFVSDNLIITKNEDREVYLQSVANSSETMKLPGVPQSWDKNRTLIATVVGPGNAPGEWATVLLIEATTGEILNEWPAKNPWVSLNADGSLISIREGEEGFGKAQWFRIIDTNSGEEMEKIHLPNTEVKDVAWNNKGDQILIRGGIFENEVRYSSEFVQVWDAATGEKSLDLPVVQVDHAAWNSDDTWILTRGCNRLARGECSQYGVQVWAATTGDRLIELDHVNESIWAATWNQDESLILTLSRVDQAVRIWDAKTGIEQQRLSHPGQVCRAGWSSDERFILTNGFPAQYAHALGDCPGPQNHVWDAKTGKELFSFGGGYPVLNSDGTIFMVTGENAVRQYYIRMEDLRATACEQAPRNMNGEEWLRIKSSVPYTKTCSNLPVHPSVIKSISDAGRDLIIAGEIEKGVAQIQQTLKATLHPDLIDDPKTKSPQQLVAAILIEQGRDLAQQGQAEESLRLFQQALGLDQTLELDPYTEAHKWDGIRLINEGQQLAQRGYVEEALAKFHRALELESSLMLDDPEAYASQLASTQLVEQASSLASEGEVEKAVDIFSEGKEYVSDLEDIDVSSSNWLLLTFFVALQNDVIIQAKLIERQVRKNDIIRAPKKLQYRENPSR